ncbi:MAG: extracellular solute-binding protein, partial [Gemmatimonadaceae bacterium]
EVMLMAMSYPIPFRFAFVATALVLGACSAGEKSASDKAAAIVASNATATGAGTIRLFNAASIGRPLKVLADSFTARTSIAVVQESQSSLELARKLTEFNDVPDILALADYKVFTKLLQPKFLDGYWIFARNRLVIGYTEKSRHQTELVNDGWRTVLTRSDVEVGRSDPNTDPSGYRTLMAFQLAELHYNEKGLAARLLAAAPPRNVRPREADQVGLLQAGTLDYIWTYENLARGARLKFVELPPSIDLGNAADSLTYAKASVRVAGKQRGDSVTFKGEPILYGVAVPFAAPNATAAKQFLQFMLSADGQRILRAAQLDALEQPIPAGSAANSSTATQPNKP